MFTLCTLTECSTDVDRKVEFIKVKLNKNLQKLFGFFRAHYNFKLFSRSGLHFRVQAGFGPDLIGPLTTLVKIC